MRSYSLVENLYNPYNLEQELLVEGFNADTAKSLLQWVVAGVAEYGVGALTLPAAGSGLVVGPVMDTLVDLMFTAEKIKSSFDVVKQINTMFDEYKTLIGAVRDAYNPSNLKNYYPTVVELIKKFVADFFKAAGEETASDITEKIESSVDKIKEIIEKAIDKLIPPIKAGVKLIVPDATIGLAVGEAIQGTLQALAENGFDTLVSAIEKFDLFFKFITDPKACVAFFQEVFESLVGMLEDVIKGIKGEPPEENQGQTAISTEIYFSNGEPLNEMLGLSIPGLGDSLTNPLKIKALEFVVSTVKKGKDLLIDLIKQMLEIVTPTIITLLAVYQALMTGDWKPSNEEIEQYSGKDLENPPADSAQQEFNWLGDNVILEQQFRKLIQKLIIEDNFTKTQMYNIDTHGKI